MADYKVFWEIDISADSPREAAEQAWALMRAPNSSANSFSVSDGVNIIPVDLEEVESDQAAQDIRVGDVVAIRGDLRRTMDGKCQYTADQLVDGKYLKHTRTGEIWTGVVEKRIGDEALVAGGWRHISRYELFVRPETK
ncbi:MAG TPA: hypothetical protein VEC35_10975 [Noviherbaspirillum sp.]|nr:hypothetical protein [Noviherbaspirillum sp.]